jgi:hypothetical protein
MTSPEYKAVLMGEDELQQMLDDPKLRTFLFTEPDGVYTSPTVSDEDLDDIRR